MARFKALAVVVVCMRVKSQELLRLDLFIRFPTKEEDIQIFQC